ncbi:hypothetical protein RF11_03000 [Thelohanellus kitauei]|uniref:Uncharacterized protein n=1 Tax=Thelohanellus kitauei TaxID=669202 RepID=A0A0C2N717_THEKT|nr:hypothetical protein RF11_02792 [Thelohanellus kitauei]KII72095.1 hypothetical protein RF11_03000 [Thelohanellus kitauei]
MFRNYPHESVDYPVVKSENPNSRFYPYTEFQKKLVEVYDYVLLNGLDCDYYDIFVNGEISEDQKRLLEYIYDSRPLEKAIHVVLNHPDLADISNDRKEYWMALKYVASILPSKFLSP